MASRDDTSLGGKNKDFPSTSISLLARASDLKSPIGREAYDTLCSRYWKPVYSYIRSFRACTSDEAKDLTQDFFLEIIEGKLIPLYMPHYGSFRAFLRGSLKILVLHHRRRASAQKRGGGRNIVSIDEGEARRLGDQLASAEGTPEEIFDRQWAESVTDQANEDLRNELLGSDKESYFRVFERYEKAGTETKAPTYADVAKELGLRPSDVSNYLTWCRNRLKELLLYRVREYVTGDKEANSEILQLFKK